MRVRGVLLVACALAASPIVVPAAGGCRQVPALGYACETTGGWRITLASGARVLTHGGDPVPSHAASGSFDQRVAPVCAADPSRELHGRAVYAHAIDRADRSAALRDEVIEMVERANGMLRHEAAASGRRLDYRMRCDAGDVVEVTAATLATPFEQTTFETLVNDLQAAGFMDPLAKYWIFFDGRPPEMPAGTATIEYDQGVAPMNRNNFGPSYGVTWGFRGTTGARVMMHENAHTLGAVQLGALHSTGAGHCNDGRDVMCYADGGPRAAYDPAACAVTRFDCNNDDYFDPSPAPNTVMTRIWNLGSPLMRALEGCSFTSTLLGATTAGPVRTHTSIPVPASCRGAWFAAMAFPPPLSLSADPAASRAPANLPVLDVDVCWYAGTRLLRCDTQGRWAVGLVPADTTAARVHLASGPVADVVLSIV